MNNVVLFNAIVLFGLTPNAIPQTETKREPRYEGKPLQYWVQRLEKCEKEEERKEAATAIKEFGPDAAPVVADLVKMLDDRSQSFRETVGEILCAMGPAAKSAVPTLTQSLKEKAARSPDIAVRILCAIGTDAKKAIPAIRFALLDNKYFPLSSCQITELPRLGPDAIPLLIELLQDKDEAGYCAIALAKMGPAAKKAIPGLKKALSTRGEWERYQAAIALWKISGDTAGVDVLRSSLKDNVFVSEPAKTLGEMGPAARSALPELQQLCCHEDSDIAQIVREAIRRIDPDAAKKLPEYKPRPNAGPYLIPVVR